MLINLLESRRLFSTYFVSPTGDDDNSGYSSGSPWQTVAKVNATAFQPGDQVLFQRGGQWHESLIARSSGTVQNPIKYGAFGSAASARPLFIGSDLVSNSAFSAVAGTVSTYSMPAANVNWVYDNHKFLRWSNQVIFSGDPTANLNYVKNNPGSFYYSTDTLYVNVGGALNGHTITVGHRDDAVLSYQKSNLQFNELAVTETAKPDAGYGFRAQTGSNIQFTNCTATLAGKHHFGAIDVTGFLGKNLLASEAPPDLGYGGASAYVSFSGAARQNDTYQWINVDWQSPNGPYPIFITHGDPGAIRSVLLENLTSSGWGAGITCYSSGPEQIITIRGGHIENGTVELHSDNSLVDGLLVTGPTGSVGIYGDNDIVKNTVFDGMQPNPNAGLNGAITVAGKNATITSNIFRFPNGNGPAISITDAAANPNIRGNVFDCPDPFFQMFTGSGTVRSDRNVVRAGVRVRSGNTLYSTYASWSQWQAGGHDQHTVALQPGSFIYGSTNFSSPGVMLAVVRNNNGAGARLYGNGSGGGLFYGSDAALDAMLITSALRGDTNLDGQVDVADLGNLSSSYGTSGAGLIWLQGDSNYDGAVGPADLGDIATFYGDTAAGAGASAVEGAAIAEPAAVIDIQLRGNRTPFTSSTQPIWEERSVWDLLTE